MEACARLLVAVLTLMFTATAASSADADDWQYRDHDIRKFYHHDVDAWRHGRVYVARRLHHGQGFWHAILQPMFENGETT